MATIAPAEQYRQMELLADEISIDLKDFGVLTIAEELIRLNTVRKAIVFGKYQAEAEARYLKQEDRMNTQEFADLLDTVDLAKMLERQLYDEIVSLRAISRMISPFASEEAQEI